MYRKVLEKFSENMRNSLKSKEYIYIVLSYVSNCPNIMTPHSLTHNNFNPEDYSSYLNSHIKYDSCKSHSHEVYSDLRPV